jgi:hypothetical protein
MDLGHCSNTELEAAFLVMRRENGMHLQKKNAKNWRQCLQGESMINEKRCSEAQIWGVSRVFAPRQRSDSLLFLIKTGPEHLHLPGTSFGNKRERRVGTRSIWLSILSIPNATKLPHNNPLEFEARISHEASSTPATSPAPQAD